MSAFFDITKVANFSKNGGISKTQERCNVIYIFFRSSLGNV